MTTLLNENEFNNLVDKIINNWTNLGISAEEAGKAFNNLITKFNDINNTNSCDAYELRGGKGNKKMAMLRPRSSAHPEDSNQKYDLEIFDANDESRLNMLFDEDYVYIIPTVQQKPMKVVFDTSGDY